MRTLISATLIGLSCLTAQAFAQSLAKPASRPPSSDNSPALQVAKGGTDSQQMSRDLKSLPWKSFRKVVEAVPKLSAAVNAYGPAGWNFVKANYTRYNWTKQINKLDASQKKQLAELIRKAKANP